MKFDKHRLTIPISLANVDTYFFLLAGLGISLEGTVDVERGIELRPHHYIRSILPEGPVGQNGKLSPGDELLEVPYSFIYRKNNVLSQGFC